MSHEALRAPRFVVTANGKQLCVAGVDGYSILTAILSRVSGTPGIRESSRSLMEGAVDLQVAGMRDREQLLWLNEELVVGDELTVRLLEGGPYDQPTDMDFGSRDAVMRRVVDRRERMAKVGNVAPARMAVAVNGEHKCTAGVSSGALTITITFVWNDPATRPPHVEAPAEDSEGGCVDLSVGGLENDVYLSWLQGELDVGDELAFRVLGPGPIDQPEERKERHPIPHEREMIMSTPRTTLRKFVNDDLDFLAELLGDADVMRFWPKPLDRIESEEWLRRQQQRYVDDGCGYWLVVDSESHDPVGQAGIIMTVVDGERLPALGFMIHRRYWRQGFGIDAAWASVCLARHRRDDEVVYTLIRPENEPSIGLARKLGMKPVRTVMHEGFEHLLFEMKTPE
jgi:RimJ/RimL family protein N-acetyltransferase